MMRFGIEHEVAFIKKNGVFADFTNTAFEELNEIIQELPVFPDDYPTLRIGDQKIKVKRWYIEGYERFSEDGSLASCPPKGIEIRTVPETSIPKTILQLRDNFELLRKAAERRGFRPTWTSFNPFRTSFAPSPPLNRYERERRRSSPEKQTARLPMLTYGPDINVSFHKLGDSDVIEIGKKLTYYSPYVVPFSFSSPFYAGKLWGGLSARTYYRTGARPAALVFLRSRDNLIKSNPSLTKLARLASERGRIEFKAFDSCSDTNLYAALFALIKGLALDMTLAGRRITPEKSMHRLAAREGFRNQTIAEGARNALNAAETSLRGDPDSAYLPLLRTMLAEKTVPSDILIQRYRRSQSIGDVLQTYGTLI